MSIVLDGTNGITTPDVDTDGLTVDTNTLFVDAANNRVGIGQSYGLTNSRLVVAGQSPGGDGAYATGRGSIVLNEGGRTSVNDTGGLEFKTSVFGSGYGAKIVALDNGTLAFANRDNFATFSERMRITSDGNVGIGPSDTNRLALTYDPTSGLATVGPNSTGGSTALSFGTSLSGSFSERARIDTSGNLLVGTTSGSARITTNAADLEGIRVINDSGATRFPMAFQNGANTVGSIQTSTTSTSYNTGSDYRLKEDVQPMVGSVDRLMALRPVNFAWKVDGSRVDGFLAHEAQEVVPEAVTGEKDAVDKDGKPEYQGIDQSKLVPLLTAALQEALQKIEALEARVAALETNA